MSRITKRRVDSLEPGQTAWDSDLRGFGIRCRSGSKSYILKYRYYGRQRMYTIGRHGSPWTPETARAEAKRLLGAIASGADPAGEKQDDKDVMQLAQVAKIFSKHHIEARLKPNSVVHYRRLLDQRIIPAFGKLPIAKITRMHVTNLHYDMRHVPVDANQTLLVLSKLFSWAEENSYVPNGFVNPCKKCSVTK